uniref:Uncharacterized protein n=1 Tax=Rhizophora mucronata TaxID=61149 RepID=A0A2P2QE31_RHIMU
MCWANEVRRTDFTNMVQKSLGKENYLSGLGD